MRILIFGITWSKNNSKLRLGYISKIIQHQNHPTPKPGIKKNSKLKLWMILLSRCFFPRPLWSWSAPRACHRRFFFQGRQIPTSVGGLCPTSREGVKFLLRSHYSLIVSLYWPQLTLKSVFPGLDGWDCVSLAVSTCSTARAWMIQHD